MSDHTKLKQQSLNQARVPDAEMTPLARRLWALRSQIVASGERLLSREEVEREVADRRGIQDQPQA